jgi:2-polyprenyl-6-methoxyphenol hydroxylase-like FAD-dependent oxidoreductase
LLIGCSPTTDQVAVWRADPRRALRAALGSDPITAAMVCDSDPDGKVCGTIKERFFFRRAAGRGWALVGDAGHHKEFLLGDGMTEALLQARSLAVAISDGTDGAMARWWRARDVAALPFYFAGHVAGAPKRPAELQRLLFTHLSREPALMARIVAVIDRRLPLSEALPVTQLLSWITAASLRGRWRVIPEMLGMARHAWAAGREMRMRSELLARAEALFPTRSEVPLEPTGRAANAA